MSQDNNVVTWLLDSDPTLKWQVERDLLKAPQEVWRATRALIPSQGFGAELLAYQDSDGQWAGGAYFPADFDFESPEAAPGAGQPWTATTWSLNALREWGLDACVLSGTAELLAINSRWEYEDLAYWDGEVDCCINAFTLANGAWLGVNVEENARWFADHQLPDGGWNCEWVEGSTRSSFHSTLNSLKGLLSYEITTGNEALAETRHRGEQYLLTRKLMYRLSTGKMVGGWVPIFAYPFRSFYSVLNAADYFRSAVLHDGKEPPAQLAEAVEVIRAARQPDGTWLQERRHPGREWFAVDVPAGQPSKWLTFYSSRILDWWDGRTAVQRGAAGLVAR